MAQHSTKAWGTGSASRSSRRVWSEMHRRRPWDGCRASISRANRGAVCPGRAAGARRPAWRQCGGLAPPYSRRTRQWRRIFRRPGLRRMLLPARAADSMLTRLERPKRELWRAPGDVVIEEGNLPFGMPDASSRPRLGRNRRRTRRRLRPARGLFNRAARGIPATAAPTHARGKRFSGGRPAGVTGRKRVRAPATEPAQLPAAPPRIFDERAEQQPSRRGGLLQRRSAGAWEGATRTGWKRISRSSAQRQDDQNPSSRHRTTTPRFHFFNRNKG